MATMYPPRAQNIAFPSAAEEKLYRLFSQHLGPEYHVAHSVVWHQRDRRGVVRDGEADFVLIHPDNGILILEVKGGRVTTSGRDFFTYQRSGSRSKLHPSPLDQAKQSMHILLDLVPIAPPTKPYAADYHMGYFVWFPDILWKRGTNGWLRGDDALILDKADMATPEDGLQRIYDHFAMVPRDPRSGPRQRLSESAIRAFIELLDERPRPPQWVLLPLLAAAGQESLGVAMERESRRMERLTRDQADRFAQIVNHPRVMIPGAAGTGKTMVALESAYRFAHEGKRVLVVCPGEALAEWLRTLVDEYWNDGGDVHFDVFGLKALCIHLAGATGTPTPGIRSLRVDWNSHQAKLSSLLRRAGEALRQRHPDLLYDVIVVDDAHDFNQEMAGPIQKLLREPQSGRLYAFYDLRQRVDFHKTWQWAIGDSVETQPLTENVRNTRHIYETMRGYQKDLRADQCRGPDGRAHIYLNPSEAASTVGATDLRSAVLHTLDWLIDEQNVAPDDIGVITCLGRPASLWEHFDQRRIGTRYELCWLATGEQPRSRDRQPIALATMRTCKGREWPVVILTELEGLKRLKKTRLGWSYIAASRAKHQLIVVGDPQELLH